MDKIAEIRLRLSQLQFDKDAITGQINAAERALRMKGRDISRLQIELGLAVKEARKSRAAENKSQQVSFERQFMFQARSILPRDLYELVLLRTTQTTHDKAE